MTIRQFWSRTGYTLPDEWPMFLNNFRTGSILEVQTYIKTQTEPHSNTVQQLFIKNLYSRIGVSSTALDLCKR